MEFLGCCAALRGHPPFGEGTCVCCQTDNTKAESWLHKTNFYKDPEKIELPRWLGEHHIKNKYCLYSQWFAGKANIVSDSLLRDYHLSNTELTPIFYPNILNSCQKRSGSTQSARKHAPGFTGCCWLGTRKMQSPPQPTRYPIGAYAAGSNLPTNLIQQ
jgi:hypothetical protein